MITSSDIRSTSLTGNIYLDSLTFVQAYQPGTAITYVLQGQIGDGTFGGSTWSANSAREAFASAVQRWSEVANITFVEAAGPYNGVGSAESYDWVEAFDELDPDLLGQHALPQEGTLGGFYNIATGVFTATGLMAGGLGFAAFVHETGHGLGLLHPHNDGDEPANDPVFPGVFEFSDLGDYGLNQGIYTVMSYNHGFDEIGIPSTEDFGWEMGPMAFDIAVAQQLYGANMSTRTGDTAYELPSLNAPGTGWRAIWDAGGIDTITAGDTTSDAILDLRAATLEYDWGGGGFISRITGVLGGLTIANGVVIENAIGGGGDDWFFDNSGDNRLEGGAGYDTVDYSEIYNGIDFPGFYQPLVIDLKNGLATGHGQDTLIDFEAAIGGPGDDVLIAADGVLLPNGLRDLLRDTFPNVSRENPLDLDYHFYDRSADPTIAQELGMVSVVVVATADGVYDYYSFSTDGADRIILDIDNTYNANTTIEVFDSSYNLIAKNEDGETLDPGSANFLDAYLVLDDFPENERLIVRVSSDLGNPTQLRSKYELKISLDTARVETGSSFVGSRLEGGDGNDRLIAGSGDDLLMGGLDTDTAVFEGNHDDYEVTSPDGFGYSLLVSSPAGGTDFLDNIEWLEFADGSYTWLQSDGKLVQSNAPPILASQEQRITADEDSPVQFTVEAYDPDGDPITYTPTSIASGNLTGDANGAFTYVPQQDFVGEVHFSVLVSAEGGALYQHITIDFEAVNDAPFFATSIQTLQAKPGEARELSAEATDPDGDLLTYTAGSASHGSVTGGASGQFTYTPDPAFLGTDSFTITAHDGKGGTANQTVNVTVSAIPPDTDFRLFATDGFAGEIGGSGQVFGTAGFQDIAVLDVSGTVTFDPSFNKGGDIVRLAGDAGDWQVVQSGSSAIFSDGDTFVQLPVGTTGMAVVFDDGVRSLRYDTGEASMKIGAQSFAGELVGITAPSDGTPLPTGADPDASGRLFLTGGAQVTAGGDIDVFGTTGAEQLTVTQGDFTLDPSFNKGGDTLALGQPAPDFLASVSGSGVLLDSASTDIAIPLGTAGMTLSFPAGDNRTVLFDTMLNSALVGTQEIDMTPTALAAFG
ncbi:MAG: tandem-95 repeat protein [Novosphingobium sp.]